MSMSRSTHRLLAIFICGLLVAVAATSVDGQRTGAVEGYVLSAREMATIFGDAPGDDPPTGNNQCKWAGKCRCQRPGTFDGKAGCQYCDDGEGGGWATEWSLCKYTANGSKSCNEKGANACSSLNLWHANTSQVNQDWCDQCNGQGFFDTKTFCEGLRKEAQGDDC